jgi:hypothetical protein
MTLPHVVLTGPIRTDITLDDGTVVDVRPDAVHCESQEQAIELAQKISEHYEEHGHPSHDSGDEFVYDRNPGGEE